MNNTMNDKRSKTLRLTQLGLLAAIIIVMTLTSLDYLKVGILEITFLAIPVAIGAVALGPAGGAILGAVFGLTSFARSFGLNGLGVLMLQHNPIYTFIICMVPRVLVGLFSGYVYKYSDKMFKKESSGSELTRYALASLTAALTNTLLFLGLLLLFFGSNSTFETGFVNLLGGSDAPQGTVLRSFVIYTLSFNGIIEAIACTVLGTLIIKGVMQANKKQKI
ncbi:MAG: ECF transporter S component [Eubacteriales bacterium]|nr:ECF transporter S component [Eubacteriales bacterium]MDD4475356.1 ECF transporter S component [Eubacteriales bacterium]